ncbi:hypothetical protein BF1_1509, partial [Bifidobacterium bifidum]
GSHPSRGAWIEIGYGDCSSVCWRGRTPHGVRGLKFTMLVGGGVSIVSHPSRGAWIEIHPYGGGGVSLSSRTPHGVRGLKSLRQRDKPTFLESHPSRGAWIEISTTSPRQSRSASHPSRGAWIEISTTSPRQSRSAASHPSRGAWIEIGRGWCGHHRRGRRTPHGVRGLKYHDSKENPMNNVAPLTGCVD